MSIMELSISNWNDEVLLADTLVIIDFWHDTCGWCKRLEPIYQVLAKKYQNKLKFTKFNVLESQENQQFASNYGVMGTPTLMFFCEARSVGVLVGFQPQDRLIQQIEDMLNNYQKCLRQSTSLTPKN
ncbi:MAG: thioredoxin family protein [Candidatus Bathyarchaeota archaeon]|nr:thioredoxin family protein [Candidatus Bathyarchaeota archaeon]